MVVLYDWASEHFTLSHTWTYWKIWFFANTSPWLVLQFSFFKFLILLSCLFPSKIICANIRFHLLAFLEDLLASTLNILYILFFILMLLVNRVSQYDVLRFQFLHFFKSRIRRLSLLTFIKLLHIFSLFCLCNQSYHRVLRDMRLKILGLFFFFRHLLIILWYLFAILLASFLMHFVWKNHFLLSLGWLS